MRVRERLPVGVMEVHRDARDWDARAGERVEQRDDLMRRADAAGVTERDLVAAHVEEPARCVTHRLVRRGPVPRIGDDHR